ncbi:MAG: hypothetical protein WA715_16500, partial [Candidatus Acidiferrum sp.]
GKEKSSDEISTGRKDSFAESSERITGSIPAETLRTNANYCDKSASMNARAWSSSVVGGFAAPHSGQYQKNSSSGLGGATKAT